MNNWTTHDIPPQHGRLAVITGATGGLGYETALALAGAGARTGGDDDSGELHPRSVGEVGAKVQTRRRRTNLLKKGALGMTNL